LFLRFLLRKTGGARCSVWIGKQAVMEEFEGIRLNRWLSKILGQNPMDLKNWICWSIGGV
jgi:hypothetical protein